MSILFTLKGELDRQLYWIQMRQEALRFISGYRRNNIIDISFPEKGFNRWSGYIIVDIKVMEYISRAVLICVNVFSPHSPYIFVFQRSAR